MSDGLDTVVSVETPEGILLELRPAGLTVRFYAFLIDWLIRLMVLYAVAMAASVMGGIGMAIWLIVIFACEWIYPIFFELRPGSATPGKQVFNLKVVMDDGLPVTPAASITRNLLRAADFLPFSYGFAVVSMLLRRDYKRLGDIAASTIVVHSARPPVFDTVAAAPPLTPVLLLTPRTQAALIALAARASRLTSERVDELAALAAAVSGDHRRSGPRVTRRVLGVAQWALGRRS
jgi:uncharacterized RDD family membrane protein YckC